MEIANKDFIIMSHRGANIYAPQNTLPAFRKTFELGFDSFETDVHCTKDGAAVICHDYKIDRISNGTGLISDYTLEELRAFDFGAYFGEAFKKEKIPTLDEVLTIVSEYGTNGIINIEIKPPHTGDNSIAQTVIECVRKHNLIDNLMISSFDIEILRQSAEIEPHCRTALLYPQVETAVHQMFFTPFSTAAKLKLFSVNPLHIYMTKARVAAAHRAGLRVFPWTPNTKQDIKHCIEMGVDGIITDYPQLAKEIYQDIINN